MLRYTRSLQSFEKAMKTQLNLLDRHASRAFLAEYGLSDPATLMTYRRFVKRAGKSGLLPVHLNKPIQSLSLLGRGHS